MVELVLTYCLLANAASCIERRPILEESFNLISCMLAAQQLGAAYVAAHPAYRLIGWRCGATKQSERAVSLPVSPAVRASSNELADSPWTAHPTSGWGRLLAIASVGRP